MTIRTDSVLEGPLHLLARSAWQAVALTGLLSVVLGIVVLSWPGPSILVAGIIFGIYLLVSGLMQLVAAFGTHISTGMRVLAFISGALSVLLGVFCFRSELGSVLLLAVWIGIGWLFRGITQVVVAVSDTAMPARGWQGFFGVITVAAGIVLIDSPFDSIGVLTVVGGIWLIALGVVEVVTAFRLKSEATKVPNQL